jgi:hypothetical protein
MTVTNHLISPKYPKFNVTWFLPFPEAGLALGNHDGIWCAERPQIQKNADLENHS